METQKMKTKKLIKTYFEQFKRDKKKVFFGKTAEV